SASANFTRSVGQVLRLPLHIGNRSGCPTMFLQVPALFRATIPLCAPSVRSHSFQAVYAHKLYRTTRRLLDLYCRDRRSRKRACQVIAPAALLRLASFLLVFADPDFPRLT